MRNITAVARRIVTQLIHDRRTLIAMMVAPVFVMWLLSLILTTDDYVPRVALPEMPPQVETLYQQHAEVVPTESDVDQQLKTGEVDAIITIADSTLQVQLNGSDPVKTQAVLKATQEVVESYRAQLTQHNVTPGQQPSQMISKVSTSQLYGDSSWKSYDYIGPTLVGIFLFVFTFISSQMAMVSERAQGTVERFLATPVKSWQVVAGYALAFALTGFAQSLIITSMAIWVIGIQVVGQLWLVLLIGLTIAVASVVMGLMASALARTPMQVIQLMLVIVTPQILLSGVFNLAGAPKILDWISIALPLRHGVDALKAVMIRGASVTEVAPELGILWAMIALFFIVAAYGMRKKRAR